MSNNDTKRRRTTGGEEGSTAPENTPPPAYTSAPSSHNPYEDRLPEEELSRFSALQVVDLLTTRLAFGHLSTRDLGYLRSRVEELEENQDEARAALEKMSEVIDKLSSPALRIGTVLRRLEDGNAFVCLNGSDYVCSVSPEVDAMELEVGIRVLLNEAMAVVKSFGFERNGAVMKIAEVLPDGRLRVSQEGAMMDTLILRSGALAKEKLRPGLEVRLDPTSRVAMEVLEDGKKLKRTLTSVEELPWEKVGGQDEALTAIRDAIELPHLHADLFKKFKHPVPKGILLYGPPGCGKTLLGKATAYNLRKQLKQHTGEDRPEFFLHVKGPEILNMWLGESERQVRELFAQCREKAAEGHLSFLFIDEAESILGTRVGGRMGHNIISTLVPMFCTEMDGIEPLQNVIVIIASNRADLIDPAILRPGRIDRKIRVRRPDRGAAKDIYSIYLNEEIPMALPREEMIEGIVGAHYNETEDNRFLEVIYRSGRRDYLHWGAMSSGALIAGVVERAKSFAIKRSIQEEKVSPLTPDDLKEALRQEYKENELFPPSDLTEDWLKLTDFEPENVVKLTPYRPGRKGNTSSAI